MKIQSIFQKGQFFKLTALRLLHVYFSQNNFVRIINRTDYFFKILSNGKFHFLSYKIIHRKCGWDYAFQIQCALENFSDYIASVLNCSLETKAQFKSILVIQFWNSDWFLILQIFCAITYRKVPPKVLEPIPNLRKNSEHTIFGSP